MAEYTEKKSKKVTSEKDKKTIATSLKRFELSKETEQPRRKLALEDLKFRAGGDEQWPAEVLSERRGDGRPCLTLNTLPASERQILNEQRQNRPAVKVHPVDDLADPDTAKVFQGVIRHIEVDSSSDFADDTATAFAVRTGGPGWSRIVKEYEHPLSNNQVLKIKGVRNPFMVYADPNAQEPDRSDMKFLHSFCDYSKDEYKLEFPDSEMASVADWSEIGDCPPEWLEKDGIRVVEYWYIDAKKDTLYALQDFSTALKSKLGDDFDEEKDERLARNEDGSPVSRETTVPIVKCCTHNAKEVLDEQEWEGRWIPWIPVMGDELDVDGKLVLEGMVRHVKDAMRMDNVMASNQVEAIGMIPKAPWTVAEGQIPEEYAHMWKTAHSKVWPYLVYKATDNEGHALPEPKRTFGEPAVQAITEAGLQFTDKRKAILGIYDAQLGARSNENSGRGIIARKQQGELGNFHYVDNLTRAIRHRGRILIDLIPKIYDTARVLRIIGEDGTPKTQMVNGSKLADTDPRKQGLKHMYDLGVGTYDVVALAEPSYATKRLEAVATQLELIKSLPPEVAANLLDIVVANMDLPGGELLVERLKKMLNPALRDDDENAQPIPPQAKQKMAQQGQMVEQLTHALNDANTKLATKQPEIESRERIEMEKLKNDVAIAEITAKTQSERERVKWEHERWMALHDAASDHMMQSTDMLHDDTQREAAQSHEATQAASAQAHTADMAQQAQVAEQSASDGA